MHRRPQFEPLARLAAAGCGLFGPVTCVWPVYHIGCVCLGPLSCVGSFVRLGVAAAALPPGRSWLGCAAWVWAGCLALVSRRCVSPAGRCCGGFAAGALWGWLCRLGLGWVLGLRLASVLPPMALSGRFVFISIQCLCLPSCAGDFRRRSIPLWLPPFVSNRPLSEGAAGVSRLGGRVGTRTIPSGFALTICKSPPCACALGGLAVFTSHALSGRR